MRNSQNHNNKQTPQEQQQVPNIDLLYCFADPMDTLHFNLMYERYVTNAPDRPLSSYKGEQAAKNANGEFETYDPFDAMASTFKKWKEAIKLVFKGAKV